MDSILSLADLTLLEVLQCLLFFNLVDLLKLPNKRLQSLVLLTFHLVKRFSIFVGDRHGAMAHCPTGWWTRIEWPAFSDQFNLHLLDFLLGYCTKMTSLSVAFFEVDADSLSSLFRLPPNLVTFKILFYRRTPTGHSQVFEAQNDRDMANLIQSINGLKHLRNLSIDVGLLFQAPLNLKCVSNLATLSFCSENSAVDVLRQISIYATTNLRSVKLKNTFGRREPAILEAALAVSERLARCFTELRVHTRLSSSDFSTFFGHFRFLTVAHLRVSQYRMTDICQAFRNHGQLREMSLTMDYPLSIEEVHLVPLPSVRMLTLILTLTNHQHFARLSLGRVFPFLQLFDYKHQLVSLCLRVTLRKVPVSL